MDYCRVIYWNTVQLYIGILYCLRIYCTNLENIVLFENYILLEVNIYLFLTSK